VGGPEEGKWIGVLCIGEVKVNGARRWLGGILEIIGKVINLCGFCMLLAPCKPFAKDTRPMLKEGTCPQLKDLSVCHNHGVGDADLRALVEAMQGGAPCNETMESLLFHECDIGWEDGARVYLEVWDQGCLPRVETHGLAVNPIGPDGIRALCRMYAAGKLRRKAHLLWKVGVE